MFRYAFETTLWRKYTLIALGGSYNTFVIIRVPLSSEIGFCHESTKLSRETAHIRETPPPPKRKIYFHRFGFRMCEDDLNGDLLLCLISNAVQVGTYSKNNNNITGQVDKRTETNE